MGYKWKLLIIEDQYADKIKSIFQSQMLTSGVENIFDIHYDTTLIDGLYRIEKSRSPYDFIIVDMRMPYSRFRTKVWEKKLNEDPTFGKIISRLKSLDSSLEWDHRFSTPRTAYDDAGLWFTAYIAKYNRELYSIAEDIVAYTAHVQVLRPFIAADLGFHILGKLNIDDEDTTSDVTRQQQEVEENINSLKDFIDLKGSKELLRILSDEKMTQVASMVRSESWHELSKYPISAPGKFNLPHYIPFSFGKKRPEQIMNLLFRSIRQELQELYPTLSDPIGHDYLIHPFQKEERKGGSWYEDLFNNAIRNLKVPLISSNHSQISRKVIEGIGYLKETESIKDKAESRKTVAKNLLQLYFEMRSPILLFVDLYLKNRGELLLSEHDILWKAVRIIGGDKLNIAAMDKIKAKTDGSFTIDNKPKYWLDVVYLREVFQGGLIRNLQGDRARIGAFIESDDSFSIEFSYINPQKILPSKDIDQLKRVIDAFSDDTDLKRLRGLSYKLNQMGGRLTVFVRYGEGGQYLFKTAGEFDTCCADEYLKFKFKFQPDTP